MKEGKSQKQSLAIAYALAKKAKKMSEGGEVYTTPKATKVEQAPDSENMVTKIMKSRVKEVPGTEIDDFDYIDSNPAETFSYDEANSGDALGNDQQDADRKDMVAMIMKQRKLKATR